MSSVAFALLAAALLAAGMLSWRIADLKKSTRAVRRFRLEFPRDLTAEAVITFLSGLSGIRPPFYRSWFETPFVILEIDSSVAGIEHTVSAPVQVMPVVAAQLRAALPGVRMEEVPAPRRSGLSAVELQLRALRRPLRTDDLGSVSTALLASVLPLGNNEAVTVQWIISPGAVPKPARLATPKDKQAGLNLIGPDQMSYELLPHSEALRAEQAKLKFPLFWAVGRVGVRTKETGRARRLRQRVLAGYHLLNTPGASLARRLIMSDAWAARRLRRQTVPLLYFPALLNAAELCGVIGWPTGGTPLPGLSLGGCRQLPPSSEIPSSGCAVARATFPGSERPIAISPKDRLLHSFVLGPTGSGKSNLLLNLISQDMQAGRGVIVLDPKGDLVTDALNLVPENRIEDVVVLDPTDPDPRMVGINLLDTTSATPELVAEHVVHIFHQIFSAFWGPRTDDCLRAALLTLMHEPGMTLTEVPLLLNNPAFRQRFMHHISEDIVGLAPFWSWYDAITPAERAQVIAPLMNKLRATLLRQRVRYCIGQGDPGLRLEDVLASGKLLFVPLRKGLLGDEAVSLLGSLVVSRIWQATQARTGIPASDRVPVHAYIDEAQDFLNLPTSIGDMLGQARGLGLGMTLATQHLERLKTPLRRDVLANCRSKVIFQPTADDARILEREFRPFLTAEDLQGLRRFEVVAQLAANQQVMPPATGVTMPPPEETGSADAALNYSRERYGRDRSGIEAAMRARHDSTPEPAPIGRRRRGEPS